MLESFRTQVALRAYTTLQVGGVAEYFTSVSSEVMLTSIVATTKEHGLPLRVLGGGSNVLVADSGVTGLVLEMQIKGYEVITHGTEVYITAGAGEVLDQIIAKTVADGYWGLENLSHIPGTVGATPIQNVGAYGVEVADCIVMVRAYDTEKEAFVSLSNTECCFAYRDSCFKQQAGRYIVTAVTFRLSTLPQPRITYRDVADRFGTTTPTVSEIRDAIISIRSGKFPDWHTVGTAGSFFKNPIISTKAAATLLEKYPELPTYPVSATEVKVLLGWILDHVIGQKQIVTDMVGVYEKQALVLINTGGATATDIDTYASAIEKKVFETLHIHIEREVTMWK